MHWLFRVYPRAQYWDRYFSSYTSMTYLTIFTPQSICLQMTVLYREIKNEFDSHELQKDLNRLAQWEHDWQMHFNTQKCFVIRITHARHIKHYNYTLGDSTLQETDSHPYLGVCITKDLTWNKHIHQITASANRTLAFVRRNIHSCPKKHQNNRLHNPCSSTPRIFVIRMGPPHPGSH